MRTVNDHKLEGLNDALDILVTDEPGQSGANHDYLITYSKDAPVGGVDFLDTVIRFQNGPIKEFGVNGISCESLLAIVLDRLLSFQAGPYACQDNQEALNSVDNAIRCLQKRML